VVDAETSLSSVRRELEKAIGRRLATVRGASAGVAGKVNYTVDRGPLSVSANPRALVVRTVVRANAEVCARGRCYARCRPEANVRAEVPLLLGADYRFGKAKVTAKFTRGCKIRTLGGFLTIDVTPTIERRVDPELRKVEREIGAQLPDVRSEATRLFREAGKPRALPLMGCLAPNVRAIAQAPVETEGDTLRMRFAVSAEPELRPDCDGAIAAGRLPALGRVAALPDEGELRLALSVPLEEVTKSVERVPVVEVDGSSVRVHRAAAMAAGTRLTLDLALDGDVCGELGLGVTPRWSADRRALELSEPTLSKQEAARVSSVGVDAPGLAAALVSAVRTPVPIVVDRLREALTALPAALETGPADVAVRISAVEPERVVARGDALAATLGLRGSVRLRPRSPR
jgi:hypothetical protein